MPRSDNIVVSICCATYNHENFIRDAIEGFLMQETNFPFEIIIHDDASTDSTPDIICEYAEKYPDLIVPIFQSENQYSQGKKILGSFLLPRARGKYIALCEGDDYWTSPYKLQQQVDWLEQHPESSICFHPVTFIDETSDIPPEVFEPRVQKPVYTLTDLLLMGNIIATCSVVFRNKIIPQFPSWYYSIPYGDYALYVLAAEHGDIGFLSRTMASRRQHIKGIWSGEADSVVRLSNQVTVREAIDKHFNHRYSSLIHLSQLYLKLIRDYWRNGKNNIAKSYLHKVYQNILYDRHVSIFLLIKFSILLYTPNLYSFFRVSRGFAQSRTITILGIIKAFFKRCHQAIPEMQQRWKI